ncbi:MAG: hypothetical protein PUB00_07010 [Clostridiales bacterium]|nr:hypothetical protein [Clostridiales bacterium]
MRSIIEEIYYGNIMPTDRDVVKGDEYAHLLHLLSRNSTELEETLTEAQKEVFEKYDDCYAEISDANEVTAFTIGFKIGPRLVVEAISDAREITEPKMN